MECFYGLKISPEAKLLAELFEKKAINDASLKDNAANTKKEVVEVNVSKEVSEQSLEQENASPAQEEVLTAQEGASSVQIDESPTQEDVSLIQKSAPLAELHYHVTEIRNREGNFIWWINENQRTEALASTNKCKREFLNLRRDLSKLQHFPRGGYISWEKRIFPCYEKPEGCNGIVVTLEIKERLQELKVSGIFTKA